MQYLILKPETEPPNISELRPFRSVVIVEENVSSEWQEKISGWLVRSGCLYMMAWGIDCSSWDDSVDYANINDWSPKKIPENSFVMTTWHEDDPLDEVFWYSKNLAHHPSVDIEGTVLAHISKVNKENDFLERYKRA
jgi:hypothetical protein